VLKNRVPQEIEDAIVGRSAIDFEGELASNCSGCARKFNEFLHRG
jgi:hypothetical protein